MGHSMFKTNLGNIVVYLLYMSLFPPHFIPTIVQQVYRIIFTIIVLIYLLSKGQKRILINDSLLVVISIVASCNINYLASYANAI